MDDGGIWDQRGTLTRSHEEEAGVEVPPLPEERAEPRPLRDILGIFVSASSAERERFTLFGRRYFGDARTTRFALLTGLGGQSLRGWADRFAATPGELPDRSRVELP